MTNGSYVYACSRLSALSKRLLDEQTVRRMAESSLADAWRILQDRRYGGLTDTTEPDAEALIARELTAARREIRDLSPEPKLTDLLLLREDVQALKLLLKQRLLDEQTPLAVTGGLYSADELTRFVRERDYRSLPDELAQALKKLEKELELRVDPQWISISLDAAYLRWALNETKASPLMYRYFAAEADFDNVLTFLRLRAMGADRDTLSKLLLPEGGITHKSLLDCYELSEEGLMRILDQSVCRRALLTGLNEMDRTGNIGAVEKARDDYLLSLVNERRHDTESLYPLVGYYLAKQREAKAVRLVLTAKRNGLSDSVITERLVKLYG